MQGLHGVGLAHVDLEECVFGLAHGLDLVAEALAVLRAQPRDVEIGAGPREGEGGGAPDAGSAADEQHVLAREILGDLLDLGFSHLLPLPTA